MKAEIDAVFKNDPDAAISASKRLAAQYILRGVIVALAVTLVLIATQKLLSFHDTFDTALDGFKAMIMPLGTLVAGFTLKEVNDVLGLTDYVIATVQPLMSPGMLPAVVFVTMAFLAFATGSWLGMRLNGTVFPFIEGELFWATWLVLNTLTWVRWHGEPRER